MATGDLVYIESPYAETEARSVEDHVEYAKLCMLDCLRRGEHPFSSNLLFPQVPEDLEPELSKEDKRTCMKAGMHWAEYADLRVIYTDMGISKGMEWGIAKAGALGQKIEYRKLGEKEKK